MTDNVFDLSGRTALVTGAGSGLGIEFARCVAAAGGDVICTDLDPASAEKTAALVVESGRRAVGYGLDVTDLPAVRDVVEAAERDLAPVDILFNNAGIADPEPARLHDYDDDNWHAVIDVDLHGVYNVSKAVLGGMVERGRGKIINIASMWGMTGSSSVFPIPAYTAAKGAVVNLTRELGLQYATDGIQVNALCPGFYRTRLAGGAYDDPEFVAAISAFTPMGRVAEAAEIRGPALFLASSASDFMTGQTLVVDGGCMAK